MRVVDGADVAWSDPGPTVVLSRAASKVFWRDSLLIGRSLAFNVQANTLRVVGIATDARQMDLATPAGPVVYVSFGQFINVVRSMTIVVRGRQDPAALIATLRGAVKTADSNLPLSNVMTLREVVDRSIAEPQLNATVLGAFAVVALLLASLGIYGVISYSVMRRNRVLAVRLALGAESRQVLGLIVGEGLALAGTGVVLGLVGAVLVAPVMRTWLFGIGRNDPTTLAAASIGVLIIAAVASGVPARRASRVNPLTALR
jgi:ABC-type antimicrobial peptide transport system permease subunit